MERAASAFGVEAFYYLLIASPRARSSAPSSAPRPFLLSLDCFRRRGRTARPRPRRGGAFYYLLIASQRLGSSPSSSGSTIFLLSLDCFRSRRWRRGPCRPAPFYYLLIASIRYAPAPNSCLNPFYYLLIASWRLADVDWPDILAMLSTIS